MGVRGKAWRVIRAMLQKVERRVLVNGQLSEPFVAELGVPQGAVSSPHPLQLLHQRRGSRVA